MITGDFIATWNKVCDICEIKIPGCKDVAFSTNKIKIHEAKEDPREVIRGQWGKE